MIRLLSLLLFTLLLAAQRPVVTAADYARAESMLVYQTDPLIYHPGVRPNWLGDGRFWYRDATPQGFVPMVVEIATGKQSRAERNTLPPPAPAGSTTEVASPDGKLAAFIRN